MEKGRIVIIQKKSEFSINGLAPIAGGSKEKSLSVSKYKQKKKTNKPLSAKPRSNKKK
jgi:hypothetical protein